MYLDLDFDKDECEHKLAEHESMLDQRDRKLNASKYLLHETKSSFKMKSQFQISKKQFFATISKDRPNVSAAPAKVNLNSSADKLTQNYTTSKNHSSTNSNFAYGSIRTNASAASLGAESMAGERKFDSAKKSNNVVNSMKNMELVVESYGFRNNKPDSGDSVDDKNFIDEVSLTEPVSKPLDAKGIFC